MSFREIRRRICVSRFPADQITMLARTRPPHKPATPPMYEVHIGAAILKELQWHTGTTGLKVLWGDDADTGRVRLTRSDDVMAEHRLRRFKDGNASITIAHGPETMAWHQIDPTAVDYAIQILDDAGRGFYALDFSLPPTCNIQEVIAA